MEKEVKKGFSSFSGNKNCHMTVLFGLPDARANQMLAEQRQGRADQRTVDQKEQIGPLRVNRGSNNKGETSKQIQECLQILSRVMRSASGGVSEWWQSVDRHVFGGF